MKKYWPLLFIVFMLIACHNGSKENVNRAVEVFFLGVLQVINLILFGVSAVVFSAISITSNKPVFKILGGIFLGIFTIFFLMGFFAVSSARPKHFDIYIIFAVEAIMIIVAFICLIIKPKKNIAATTPIQNKVDEIEIL